MTVRLMLALLLGVPVLASAQPTQRNLLSNSSFEETDDGVPVAWRWEPGAAKAVLAVDDTVAHSGKRSVKITNPTPRSPHVYGRLDIPVRLSTGRTYTVSCYVRSDDPGAAWIGTGEKWQFRFAFARAPQWTRVTGTFEADAEQSRIMILSESPTAGLWVDDVQLEPGDKATPYVFSEPLAEGEARLVVLQGDLVALGENLVPNSSFETLDGGMPKEWAFDQRNTDGTMTVDETAGRSGGRALKFTNGTKFGSHVYSWFGLIGGVPVEPDAEYTLSCYVRSDSPGIAWIGGGPGWRVRERFPETEGAWQRVVRTFRTGEEDKTFALMVVSESPTEGLWLDDVKLERGAEATLYVPEHAATRTQLMLDTPAEVASHQTLTLGAWLYAPELIPGAQLRAELTSAEGRQLAAAAWEGDLQPGAAWAELRYGVGAREAGSCRLKVALGKGDQPLASAESEFVLRTSGHERERLARVEQQLADVRKLLDPARAKKIDVAYPLVGVTVTENFCQFVQDDLDHKEVARAGRQIDEMERIIARVREELQALVDGRREALPVPRYATGPIRIEGTSFIGAVQWPDGRREERPVFFTGYGHFGSVRRDIEKFPAYGLNFYQVEFGPRSTVPAEAETSIAAVEAFEKVLDRSEQSGVAGNLLLSPHYFPQWAYDKWPEIGGVDAGFIKFSVDAPQTRRILERHLQATVQRLKGRPGLHSYCLANEPIYRDARQDPNNQRKWVAWLKEKYGDLAALNAAHRAEYESFEAAPIPPALPVKATPHFHDWCRFNNERFAEWHRWMADVIHEIDPDIPVHAKIMNTVFNRNCAAWGVDPELFCDLSQIAGNDCWKGYIRDKGEWRSGWQGENMFYDLLRSCRGQPIFNSENHVIRDRDWDYIDPLHIRNVIWQGAIHGQGASTMWVWERTYDAQSDAAGSIMHRPECCEAHGRVALDLMRLAPEVTALQRAPARVALIYSIASLIYSPEHQRLSSRVYQALNFTGEKIDFITERQLAAGKAAQYDVIFAPGVTHLPREAYRGLEQFDGLVVTAGEGCLGRDDLDREMPDLGLKHIARLPDIEGTELRDAIVKLLDETGLGRHVQVTDVETDRPVWGVEWRSADTRDSRLVNMVNYTQQEKRVRLTGLDGEVIDLFTGEPVPEVLTLTPLDPVLLKRPH